MIFLLHSVILLQFIAMYSKAQSDGSFSTDGSFSSPRPTKDPSPAYALLDDIFSNYDKRQRPTKGGGRVLEVTINVRLYQLLKMVKNFFKSKVSN